MQSAEEKKAYDKAYAKTPQKKASAKAWREKNKEKLAADYKVWWEKNKKELNAKSRVRMKEWVKQHPEQHEANTHRWQKNNPEKCAFMRKRYRKENPEKINQIARVWRDENREKVNSTAIYGRLGITGEQRYKIIEAHGNKCDVCQCELLESKLACVDHDHATGVIRGILCHNCNRALGLLKDNEVIIQRLVEYLRASRAKDGR